MLQLKTCKIQKEYFFIKQHLQHICYLQDNW